MQADDIIRALNRLRSEYPLDHGHLVKSGMIHFTVQGIHEEFRASVLGDECVVSTQEWHEHFATPEDLEAFLKCLFTGKAEIVVTYRGDKAVSHRVQLAGGAKPRVVSRTGSLLVPFWKPKTQKTKDYRVRRP